MNSTNTSLSLTSSSHTVNLTPIKSPSPNRLKSSNKSKTPNKRFWGQEINEESIYYVYLKKITYSCNSDISNESASNDDSKDNLKLDNFIKSDSVKRKSDRKLKKECLDNLKINSSHDLNDTQNYNNKKANNEIQCLQWETRQIRILKAATIEHIIQYILLATPQQMDHRNNANYINGSPNEERNDVSHIMHIIFCTYRAFCKPQDLFTIFHDLYTIASPQQLKFVLHYWLTNYPEDFFTYIKSDNPSSSLSIKSDSMNSSSSSSTKSEQISEISNSSKSKKNSKETNQRLIDLLLSSSFMDEVLYRKAHSVFKEMKLNSNDVNQTNGSYPISKAPSSCVIELDPKFVAQQLTAIDLENFRSLKAYTLLNGHRRNQKVQNMIKNFNLLSKHVIVTILKSHSPDLCTNHWINIALQLRKMKNFNSLKSVIAGLTNESIYRLKNVVWSKLSRSASSNFKWLSSIVDDVDNQILLRQTQLEREGTAKVSLQEDSFGTIPYLGTFLTDLTVIDNKLSNYIENPKHKGKMLINLEKCSEQFEIVTQIHLLQKNISAALLAYHQSQQLIGLSQLPTYNSTPTVPKVTRLFRTWFQDSSIPSITDNECYKLSLALEPLQSQKTKNFK